MSVLAMNQPQQQQPPPSYDATGKQGLLTSVPNWGSYLYSNILLPALSPSDWLATSPAPAAAPPPQANGVGIDYFSPDVQGWPTGAVKQEPSAHIDVKPSAMQLNALRAAHAYQNQGGGGPSSLGVYYPGYYYPDAPAIPTSLLTSSSSSVGASYGEGQGQRCGQTISPSVDIIDAQVVAEPSPLSSGHTSPKRAAKRRASSLETDESDHEHEPDHEVPEGVERDGMIWGMRVEAYRALSARERKRVRNRISARTFRAKRKEHLSSLESTLNSKDLQIRRATDEAAQLRRELTDVKRRLAKYEPV